VPHRIVIDARHLHDFGIGTYIRNLVPAIAALDFENHYILVCQEAHQQEFAALAPNFQPVAYQGTDRDKFDHLAFPFFLRKFEASLCHIPLNRVPWFMVRPYVVTIHDMSRQLFGSGGIRNQLSLYRSRRSLMRASRVIAVSMATKRAVESTLGIPPSHVRRIYSAPDPRFALKAAAPDAAAERQHILDRYQVNYPFLLYAGNIKPQKNIPRLIEAFAVLRGELSAHERFRDLRLIIIGDEISQYPDVRLAAQRSRLGQSVRFLGHVPFDTLCAFYEAAQVFVFPSLHEGFGLPPLEAMSCGTPVVTSNLSSLPEVVGDAAVLVNPENVFEIERGILEALLDPGLRAGMIGRGLEQAARFSWRQTASQVLETYSDVLRGSA
jgi:glycosyltransferase involved in cell wall biosynthesis